MSFKFDSLMSVLNQLDQGKKVTVRSLMENLEMSERTVHRYLATLQSAFPVYYDRRKGSYVFEEGYSLKRSDLSQEEILTFALAKTMMTSLGPGMEKGLESIERKISVAVYPPKGITIVPNEAPACGSEHIIPLQQAVNNYQRVEVVYRRLYDDETTTRKVDPYYIFFRDGFWNLRGYCHFRKELRSFALDRIADLTVTDQHFVHPQILPEDELPGSFGNYLDIEPVEVAVKFDKEVKPHILRKKWHQSQATEELPGGGLELRFVVNGIEEIKRWLYQWIPHVEVLSPEDLRETMAADLAEALKRHKE
jgi:predicted DNA-binding transcriptional regulator YafY